MLAFSQNVIHSRMTKFSVSVMFNLTSRMVKSRTAIKGQIITYAFFDFASYLVIYSTDQENAFDNQILSDTTAYKSRTYEVTCMNMLPAQVGTDSTS